MQQGVDTLRIAKKDDLANLKPEVDKFDIDELKTTPVDLCCDTIATPFSLL